MAGACTSLGQAKIQLGESHSVEILVLLCVLLLVVFHHHCALWSHVGHEADLVVQVAVDAGVNLYPAIDRNLITAILLPLSLHQRQTALGRLIIIHVGRCRAHELLLRTSGPVVRSGPGRDVLLRMVLPAAGVLVCTVITLLAQFGPRVATHLPRPLRLAQLTVDVAVRRADDIAVLIVGVHVRPRLLARRRLDVRVCDRRHYLGDVKLLGATLHLHRSGLV